jgi:polysaccharide export outer membrane protein
VLLGLTGQQAEERIAAAYGQKYLQNPQVSVFIKEFTTRRITIEGAVAKPGIYPITGQLTLLRALALAGGGGSYADLSEIMVFRKGQDGQAVPTQTFDLHAIREGKEPDPSVVADDVIVVKRSAARTALRDSLFRDIIDAINPFSALAPR